MLAGFPPPLAIGTTVAGWLARLIPLKATMTAMTVGSVAFITLAFAKVHIFEGLATTNDGRTVVLAPTSVLLLRSTVFRYLRLNYVIPHFLL